MTANDNFRQEVLKKKDADTGWLKSQIADKLMLPPPPRPFQSPTRDQDISLKTPPSKKVLKRWISRANAIVNEDSPLQKSPSQFLSPAAYNVSILRLRFSKDTAKNAVMTVGDDTDAYLSTREHVNDEYLTKQQHRIKRPVNIKGLISHFTPKDEEEKTHKQRDDKYEDEKKKDTASNPKVVLKHVRAPNLNVNLDTFQPKEIPKTKSQVQFLTSAMKDSNILKNNKFEGKLVSVMEQVSLKGGEILSTQGETKAKDDRYYIVQEGAVEFKVDGVTVESAGRGACFGEDRLLYRYANKATIMAKEDTTLFRLDQQNYRSIMQQEGKKANEVQKRFNPIQSKSKGKSLAGDWDLSDSDIFEKQEARRLSMKKEAPSLDDLEMIRLLGEGQFGEVWLVAGTIPPVSEGDVAKKEFYALKMQNIETRDDRISAIRNEISVMQRLSHPFIANLVHVYESSTSIDMLMGFIKGEELWSKVHRQNKDGDWSMGFSEDIAKFYTCILVDTLAFLHNRNFVFRDFKLENIMIDEDGYPILIDFGYTKHIPEGEMTFTFCGTPNYVAPEVIQLAGHNHAVDYWALGVVIYEMVSGENPFFFDGMEQLDLYKSIIDESHFPLAAEKYSADVISICNQLLEKDPSKRLGTYRSDDILEHAWLCGMPDLKEFRTKQVQPPFWLNDIENEINVESADMVENASSQHSQSNPMTHDNPEPVSPERDPLLTDEVKNKGSSSSTFETLQESLSSLSCPVDDYEVEDHSYGARISSKTLSCIDDDERARDSKQSPREHHWFADDVAKKRTSLTPSTSCSLVEDDISSPDFVPLSVRRLSSKEVHAKYKYKAYRKKRMSSEEFNNSEDRRATLKEIMLDEAFLG